MKKEPVESEKINSDSTEETFYIKFIIPDDLAEKIQKARLLYFRYYSGPEMITIKTSCKSMAKLMQLIEFKYIISFLQSLITKLNKILKLKKNIRYLPPEIYLNNFKLKHYACKD